MVDQVRGPESKGVTEQQQQQAPKAPQIKDGQSAAEARAGGQAGSAAAAQATTTQRTTTDSSGFTAGDKMMVEVTDWMKSQGSGDVNIDKMAGFLRSKGYQVERNGKTLNIKDQNGNLIKQLADNDGDGNIGMKDSSFRDAVTQLEKNHPELAGLFQKMASISQYGKQGHGDGEGGVGAAQGLGTGYEDAMKGLEDQAARAMEADMTKRLAPVQTAFGEKGLNEDAYTLWKSGQLQSVAAANEIPIPGDLPDPNGENPYQTFRKVSALAMAPFLEG